MSIDTLTPVDTGIIAHEDSFSFTVDDTYTAMVIQAVTASSTESVYDLASGGAQSGYVVSVASSGGRDTFTIARTAGWDSSPQVIYVTEDETGSSAQTSFSYSLTSEKDYPQDHFPYDVIQQGTFIVSEGGDLKVRSGTAIDFDDSHFNVTALGSGKVHVDTNVPNYPMEILAEGVSLSTHADSLSFNDNVRLIEDTPNNFSMYNRAENHSLTSHGSETCLLLFQGNDLTGPVDDTGNHDMVYMGTGGLGPGFIPGTTCCAAGNLTVSGARTSTGSSFSMGPGDAFTVYGMFYYVTQGISPFLFQSGYGHVNIEYSMRVGANWNLRPLFYWDSTHGSVLADCMMPRQTWTHIGFSRSATDELKIYVNGVNTATTTITPHAAEPTGEFSVNTPNGSVSGSYNIGGGAQSAKIVDGVLTDAQMLSEYRRMFGL